VIGLRAGHLLRCFVPTLALLAACGESDRQPLDPVLKDAFRSEGAVIAGGPTGVVVYTRFDGTGQVRLRVLRHDAAAPDLVEVAGEIDLGFLNQPTCLAVSTADVIACAGIQVVFFSLEANAFSPRTVELPIAPEVVAAEGRWLLAAQANRLVLADLQAGTSRSFDGATPVTGVVAAGGEFLAFTTTGYVHVLPDPVSPVFTPVASTAVRNLRWAWADGAEAVAAGPAPTLGRSQVLRLGVSSPATPVIIASVEVPIEFREFAWDGGAMSVVAGGGDAFSGISQGYVVREQSGGFRTAGIPLPLYFGTGSPIAAHGDRLFALGLEGLGVYRIQR
jgi:hypothetical protein